MYSFQVLVMFESQAESAFLIFGCNSIQDLR
jgi:hypothetical protein